MQAFLVKTLRFQNETIRGSKLTRKRTINTNESKAFRMGGVPFNDPGLAI